MYYRQPCPKYIHVKYVAQIMRKRHSDSTNPTVAMKNSHGSFTEPNLRIRFTEPTSLSVYQHSKCLLNIETLNINFNFQYTDV